MRVLRDEWDKKGNQNYKYEICHIFVDLPLDLFEEINSQ